jgi:predicted phage baseplate assembly protein
MLDQRTGAIRFGNGRQGRSPPAGTDSVRAFRYRVGGGQRGNVAAYALTSLKSAVTGVEAVTNPLPTRGGSDGRADDSSCAQAVATVRHVDRAITPKDIEALALDFAPEIVRARCIRPTEPEAPIVVAVAIASPEPMPQPSVALRDGLAQFLADRAASSWAAAGFRVVGPEFVRLRLKVELAPAASSPAALPSLVRDRLAGFLHPTTGGHAGKGWPFGRGLWPSDVHRALADTLDEADVTRLEITREGGGAPDAIGATAIITTIADQGDVSVRVGEGD